MAGELNGKTIAFLATEGVEQVELTEPWKAVEEAGGSPELDLARGAGQVQAFNHLDKGDTFPVDHTVADADAARYDGLVLPGGVANPDFLRMDETAVAFVRAFFDAGQAGRGHLPRPVDARRGRRGARPHAHLVAVAPDGPAQRGRDLGRRGGPRRPGPRHLPQAGRPPGLLRQARRGVRRGRARGAARGAWAPPRDAARPDARRVLDIDGTLSTRTTTTRSRGTGVPDGRRSRSTASTATSAWAATSSSPPWPARLGGAARRRRARSRAALHGADRGGRPLDGARELLVALRERGHAVVLASSAKARGRPLPRPARARELADGWTTSATWRDQAGAGPRRRRRREGGRRTAVMLGDSTWDCRRPSGRGPTSRCSRAVLGAGAADAGAVRRPSSELLARGGDAFGSPSAIDGTP